MGERARLTTVATRVNVPYDRLIAYLDEMRTARLVTKEEPPRVTPEGQEFLTHVKKWSDVLSRFGLE